MNSQLLGGLLGTLLLVAAPSGADAELRTPFNPPATQLAPGLTGDASGLTSKVSGAGAVARSLSDKDTVSVLDFGPLGATCLGTADDTPALVKALATGKSVYVPKVLPSGATSFCVFGDVALTSSNQRIFGQASVVRPAPGASRMFRVGGYANGVEGLFLQDNGNLVAKASLTADAASGATAITIGAVSSGPAVQVGQRYSIRLTNGGWATGFVTAVSGSTVTLRDPLPSAAASGNAFWSTFGLISVENATRFNIRDIEASNVWGGILVDAPTTQAAKGHIDRVNFSSGIRMFGLVKGRNSSDNTFSRSQFWGGYPVAVTATGDGSTTTFALPEQVNLTREMTSTVAGAAKTAGTDYTIATNGLSVTFGTAPANGAAVSLSFTAYGHDGLVDDGRDVTAATGGNYYNSISTLQFRRCGVLKGAQLYAITGGSIFDTCQDTALIIDGASQVGSINALVGWASGTSLLVTGNSAGVRSDDIVLAPQGAGFAVSGVTPTPIQIDAGSDLTGRVHSKAGGYTDYTAGLSALAVAANNTRTWGGTAGTMTLNPNGDVLGLSKNGFNYFACSAAGATCVFQGATAQLQATTSAKVSVGAADAVAATTTQVNVGSATQKLKLSGGGVPTLSACGTSPVLGGADQAGRITQGSGATGCTLTFATAYGANPFCVVTSEAGLAFSYASSTTQIVITNTGALSGTKLDYICMAP